MWNQQPRDLLLVGWVRFSSRVLDVLEQPLQGSGSPERTRCPSGPGWCFSVCIPICSAQSNPLKLPPGRSEAVFLGSAWKSSGQDGKRPVITLVDSLFQLGFSSRVFSQTETSLSCLSFLLLWRTSSLLQTHRSLQTRLPPARSVCHVVCSF